MVAASNETHDKQATDGRHINGTPGLHRQHRPRGGTPAWLLSLPRESRRAFRLILGHRFRVAAVTTEQPRWLQLDVHRIVDQALGTYRNSVYVEPECVA